MLEKDSNTRACLGILYNIGMIATFVKLLFLDGFHYTWINWIYIPVIDMFLSIMWPIYWLIIRPLFH